MSQSLIASTVREGVRTIALDDPERRNALSVELLDQLLAALSEARTDEETRCLILASTHPTVFCAGGNLGSFGDDAAVIDKHLANDRFPALFSLLTGFPNPALCKTGGHTVAAPDGDG